MKESVKWIAGALALVLLIVGAYLLYEKLSQENSGGDLVIDMPQQSGSATVTQAAHSTESAGSPTVGTESGSDSASDTAKATDVTANTAAQSTEAVVQSTAALEEPTNPAPDFTVVDRNGKEVKLSDMRGKPVVVNFWATWCYYCTLEMPDFDEVYKKYGNDVHFMMVNLTDTSETVQKASSYVDKEGFSFPIYFDTASEAAYAYGVSSLPASYFIDADGNLVAHAIGAIDAATIEKGIEMITK